MPAPPLCRCTRSSWVFAVSSQTRFVDPDSLRLNDSICISFNGSSALLQSVENTKYKVTNSVFAGAKLQALDSTGKSPLHYAAKFGAYSVVHWLAEAQVDVNLQDGNFHRRLQTIFAYVASMPN